MKDFCINKYVLSDGGKTDNLGLIPLVERGADLIILSQIASDAKFKFLDLKQSSGQVEKLFGVSIDTESLIRPHKNKEKDNSIVTFSCIKDDQNTISSLWLIKPTTKNVTGFYAFLQQSGKYSELFKFLKKQQMTKKTSKRFPQNNTFKHGYPQKLVYSYYALGEYIGESQLSPALNNWLKNGSQCN